MALLKGNTVVQQRAVDNMRVAVRDHDLDAYAKHDVIFHRLILEASHNDVLLRVWDSLIFDIRIRAAIGKVVSDLPEVVESHQSIVNGLERGQGREAGLLLRNHVETFLQFLKKAETDSVFFHRDLEIARDVQKAFIPQEAPSISGLSCETFYKPYVNAGLNPPCVVRCQDGHSTVFRLQPGGAPVGLFKDSGYNSKLLRLEDGDILVACTDGIIEAESRAGELWGEQRLESLFSTCAPQTPLQFLDRIVSEVSASAEGAPQKDDMTLLVMQVQSESWQAPRTLANLAGTRERKRTMNKTFVLIHGTWHGGWAWKEVIGYLFAKGHRAYAPTLAGHGPGETRSGVTHDDCVNSIVSYIRQGGLENVILVGHSFGGTVVQRAAEEIGDRITQTVFLDALVLNRNQNVFEILPAAFLDSLQPTHNGGQSATSSAESSEFDIPPWETWRDNFMQDAVEEHAWLMWERLRQSPPRSTWTSWISAAFTRSILFRRATSIAARTGRCRLDTFILECRRVLENAKSLRWTAATRRCLLARRSWPRSSSKQVLIKFARLLGNADAAY